jgi:Tfp pilus assembly pilus retraction ATPase PilT
MMQVGGKEGMVLMNDCLAKFVRDGLVDAEEALLRSTQRKDLAMKLQGMGISTAGFEVEKE